MLGSLNLQTRPGSARAWRLSLCGCKAPKWRASAPATGSATWRVDARASQLRYFPIDVHIAARRGVPAPPLGICHDAPPQLRPPLGLVSEVLDGAVESCRGRRVAGGEKNEVIRRLSVGQDVGNMAAREPGWNDAAASTQR